MLDSFWIIKSQGQHYRVTESVIEQLTRFIQDMKQTGIRDTTLFPVFFTFRDLTGCAISVDVKTVSALYESTPEIRRVDKEQANWLNQKEFPDFD